MSWSSVELEHKVSGWTAFKTGAAFALGGCVASALVVGLVVAVAAVADEVGA